MPDEDQAIKKSVYLLASQWDDIVILQHEQLVGSMSEMLRQIVDAGIITIRAARKVSNATPAPKRRGQR